MDSRLFNNAREKAATTGLAWTTGVVRAVLNVVAQHLLVPAGKGFFAAKVSQDFVAAQPFIAAFAADSPRRNRTHQPGALGYAKRFGTPAANNRRVDHHHRLERLRAQHRMAGGAHQT